MTQPEFTDQQICDAANAHYEREKELVEAAVKKLEGRLAKLRKRLKHLRNPALRYEVEILARPWTRPNLMRCAALSRAAQQKEVECGDSVICDVIEPTLDPVAARAMNDRLWAEDDAHLAKTKAGAEA